MNLPESELGRQPFLQIPRVRQVRITLRVIWIAMIFSMGWVSYVLAHALKEAPLSMAIGLPIAAVIALLSLVGPDWISTHLRPGPANNTMDTILGMLLINHILRLALTETALLFALFSIAGTNPMNFYCLYGAILALMFFHFPSDTRIELAGLRK